MTASDPWRLPSGHIAITIEQRIARVPHLSAREAADALATPKLQRPVEKVLFAHLHALETLAERVGGAA